MARHGRFTSESEERFLYDCCATAFSRDNGEIADLVRRYHAGKRAGERLLEAHQALIDEAAERLSREYAAAYGSLSTWSKFARLRTGLLRAASTFRGNDLAAFKPWAVAQMERTALGPFPEPNRFQISDDDDNAASRRRPNREAGAALEGTDVLQLIAAYQDGQASLQALLLYNGRYIRDKAVKARTSVSAWDVFSEGRVGFLQGLSKYDPDRGNRLMAYMGHHVWKNILEAHHAQSRTVPIPSEVQEKIWRTKTALHRLPHDASPEDRAKAVGMTPDELERLLRLDAGYIAYADTERMAADSANETDDPESRTIRNVMAERVRRGVAKLDPRERLVIERHILADTDETLEQIGCDPRLGVTREMVRQIEKKALRKLRKILADCKD